MTLNRGTKNEANEKFYKPVILESSGQQQENALFL